MGHSANVYAKGRRLVDAGRVLELAPNVWAVEGEHGTYLVAFVPAGANRPVFGTGRLAPGASCTCLNARVTGVYDARCSHIVAAGMVEASKPENVDALFARLGAPADVDASS